MPLDQSLLKPGERTVKAGAQGRNLKFRTALCHCDRIRLD
jgi:hypothetical protein